MTIRVDDTLKSDTTRYDWLQFTEKASLIMEKEGFAEYCLIVRPWLNENEKKQYYNIYEGKGKGLWYIWTDPVNKEIKMAVDPVDCSEIFDDLVYFIEQILIDPLRYTID